MAAKSGLAGKVALVSGGSRGIGAAVALRLARDGARVVVGYRSDVASAERVIAELATAGSMGQAVAADIARPKECERLVAQALEAFGRLDILVNAAGVATYLPLEEADADHFHATFDANVLGALALTRAAAPVMTAPGGRIIHFSSRLAQTPLAGSSVYAASKAGVAHLGRNLAREWVRQGINVNVIQPGYVQTEIAGDWFQTEGGAAHIASFHRKRMMDITALDPLMLYFASDASAQVTGGVIDVDDGQSL